MTQTEALKMALEALEVAKQHIWLGDKAGVEANIKANQTIIFIKEALAQPERDYERGFIDGMQKQMQSSVDKAVNRMAQPDQDWIERERAVGYREGHQNALKQMAQPEQEPVAWLSDDERKAFQRFYETWDDGEGYDVPKPMMKRLAQIGVIHHISRGLYDITKFGHSLLGYATSSHPPVPTAQPKELEQEISVAVLQAITNAGMTLLKTQHGYELRKLGPAIAHGIKE